MLDKIYYGEVKVFANLPSLKECAMKVLEESNEFVSCVRSADYEKTVKESMDLLQAMTNTLALMYGDDLPHGGNLTYEKTCMYARNRARGRFYEGEEKW